uniref:Dihydrolipoyllysine-residue succinyltransferase component of 2-oxoglutarate dehydrogenase complex, mitochondrial n=1 Tax=Globodera rostochiensis TaxID=31243 RepID=A0A914H3U5_GLORO
MFCAKIAQHFSPGLLGRVALLRLARSAPRSLRLYHLTQHLGGEVLEVQGPAFAESISEGDIRWNKQVGDFVKTDEIVAEIETDKTSVEVPAPFSGKIVELLVEEGGKVTAKQNLYKMEKGESDGTADEGPTTATEVPKKFADEEAPAKMEKPKPTGAAPSHPTKPPPVPPMPKEPISSKPVSEIKVPKVQQQQPPLKPKAIAEAGNSTAITGQRSETHVKMNRMRLRIAERLKEAQNTNAMLTTFNEVDLHNVVNMRKQYQEAFTKKHGVKLGLMSPFVRASAIALQEQPVVNAVIEGTEIIYRNFVDISIAVATPRGLVVPVVRNVEAMSYADIEKTLGELGVKARDNKLAIEDMEGGTFTISNGGVFGSLFGTPIINPPQSAILGMHGIFDRPAAVDGKVEIRPMMYIALTYDHRLIDGREAVTFLRKIKQAVEDPLTILLDL